MSGPTNTNIPFNLDALLARSNFYGLLTRLFRHPRSPGAGESIRELKNQLFESVPLLPYPKRELIKTRLSSFFEKVNSLKTDEWVFEHEQCFGPTAFGAVPAHEIEYGEEYRHRQPQELADIAAFYRAFGFQISERSHERVDHVSAELEFAQILVFKEAWALKEEKMEEAFICRDAFVKFLSDHLAFWAPAFMRRLSKKAPQKGILKAAAELSFEFMLQECQAMSIQASSKDLPIRRIEEKEETGCVSCERAS